MVMNIRLFDFSLIVLLIELMDEILFHHAELVGRVDVFHVSLALFIKLFACSMWFFWLGLWFGILLFGVCRRSDAGRRYNS